MGENKSMKVVKENMSDFKNYMRGEEGLSKYDTKLQKIKD